MKKHTIFTVIFLIGSIGIIGLFVWVNLVTVTETRSQAAEEMQINIPTAVPAPKTVLTSPYLRLVQSKNIYSIGTKVPVDIFLNTENEHTVEAKMVISYDPSLLSLDQSDIQNLDIFPIMNVESQENGKIIFSLFNIDDAEYEPVMLQQEKPIATLMFNTLKISNIPSEIKLEYGSNDELSSGLFGPRASDGSISPNLLQSVEGTAISIE